MKILLVGLLALASFSAFADNCSNMIDEVSRRSYEVGFTEALVNHSNEDHLVEYRKELLARAEARRKEMVRIALISCQGNPKANTWEY